MRTTAQESDRVAESCGEFEIVVIFTRIRTTLCAVKTAGRLAGGLRARIRIIVPQVFESKAQLHRLDASGAVERHFRTIVGARKIETQLEMRRCPNGWETLEQTLAPASIIVLGCAYRKWPTFESRLARKLRAAGHDVLLAFA